MSVEELLKPRYKVIADWPNTEFKVGEIICPEVNVAKFGIAMGNKFYDKYPHLFKKLEWWEERKPEELPFHLKPTKHGEQMGFQGVLKVMNYAGKYKNGCLDHVRFENGEPGTLAWFLPATAEEYNNQKIKV